MILVCGGLADSVTEFVCARLDECGYPYRLLDLGRYPEGFRIEARWMNGTPEGWIAGADWRLDLASITGAYVRFLGPEGRISPPDLNETALQALHAENDTCLMTLFEDLPCTVVNRLGGGMSNNSKPYQAMLLARCGFRVPATLVTSDPDAARAFHAACGGEVIYKSVSGIRSIVRRLGPADLDRLDLLRHGPAQFQAYIPGCNVRVHVVGDQIFATRVRSEAVDYRYGAREGHDVEMEPAAIPPAIADACLRISRELDLLLTGIDLKETPDGEFYAFEVNPCPGFLYYERHAGQPISAALAGLLRRGAAPPRHHERRTLPP
jgi:glutathione synthase/RimK-type ligase-like ATP-grasp enzyme